MSPSQTIWSWGRQRPAPDQINGDAGRSRISVDLVLTSWIPRAVSIDLIRRYVRPSGYRKAVAAFKEPEP